MLHDVFIQNSNNADSQKNLDIHQSVPDIHRRWDVFNISDAPTPFIKTHFPYQNAYKKVIYLVRDPVDVIYSLWKVLGKRSAEVYTTLDELINQQIKKGWIYG